MANAEPVISLKQVRFGYDRAVTVVDDVDAQLAPGKVTALVGPNAAGKTTLMRLMLGLLRPWSGQVRVGGLALTLLPSAARSRWLSYVPQRPGVRFAFTVRQVVEMGAHSAAGNHAQRADEVIQAAGIDDIAHRVFMQLSGGQQQRVLLARAELQALSEGRAMLLDEPGSHMDLHHRHAMMQRLRELAGRGLAVLVVLHDLDLAIRYADEAWLMDGGRMVCAGPWDTVLTPDRLGPVYRLALERIDSGSGRPILAVSEPTGDTIRAGLTGPIASD